MIKKRLFNLLNRLLIASMLAFSGHTFAQFSITDSLNSSRSNHTATPLDDGRLLVVGGFNGLSLASAEIYDPITDEWSTAGSLSFPRSSHTATKLANGKVIVSGGRVNFGLTTLASTEIYDPVSNSWTISNSMNVGRSSHTATLLANDLVLVVGGVNLDLPGTGLTTSVEIYNPDNDSWTLASSLSVARSSHTTTLLDTGKALVAAGFVGNGVSGGDTSELYDVDNDQWTNAGSLSASRSNHAANLLANGKVLIVGGQTRSIATTASLSSAEIYDPITNQWSSTNSLSAPRTNHRATTLENGDVQVTGGESGNGFIKHRSSEIYSPITGQWIDGGNMDVARRNHTSTLLSNGEVVVAGGNDGNGNISSVEIFNEQVIDPSGPPLPSTQESCYALALPEGRAVIFCL